MEHLSEDWLTQGHIDFEYKKYILLAYLKTVDESFNKTTLYPFLGDLVFHFRNLKALKENKSLIWESFPAEVSKEDFQKLELKYKKIIEDDLVMQELDAIINFAIPKIEDSLQDGTAIYEHVESQCVISAVGVTPLYAKEGYLFVAQPPENETNVYRYQVSIFGDSTDQLRSLSTTFVDTVQKKPLYTYERIKLDLLNQYRDMPNPATYLILSKLKFPLAQTLMPVARRMFVRYLMKDRT